MIRLLTLYITLLILYIGFFSINQLDSKVTLTLYDYYLETSFFTLIIVCIFIIIVSLIILNIIFFIIGLPNIIGKVLHVKKADKVNYLLMKSMTEYIMDNQSRSEEMIKKISSDIKVENKEFATFMLAMTKQEISNKIQYFQELEQLKSYSAFASKKLAQIFYIKGLYEQSEFYASKSFNLNEFDSEILDILIDSYAKLSLWMKFFFIISKLNKIDKQKFYSIESKVTKYYILAIDNMLELNQKDDAIYYLESALTLYNSNIELLDYYFALNSSNLNHKNIKMLRSVFVVNPSFRIVEIYKRSFVDLSPLQIYEDLISLVNYRQYFSLFLSIAAYLDLPEKIQELKQEQAVN